MKKLLIILVIISNYFIFQIALEKYDNIIYRNFTLSNILDGRQVHLYISGDLSTVDIEEFQDSFETVLKNYEINAYQRLLDDDNNYIIWTNTNDATYLKNISLKSGNGSINSIDKGDYYFSADGDEQGVIFVPIKNKNYKLYHLGDFSNENKSILIPYVLYLSNESEIGVYDKLKNECQDLFPTLNFEFMNFLVHSDKIKSLDYNSLLLAISTSILVILGLNVLIIKQTKKIQLLKLEGYTNWQIYKNQILKYLILILCLQTIMNIIFYIWHIDTSIQNAIPLIKYLSVANLLFISSLAILSSISYSMISFINLNLAIKGKSSLCKQKNINYIIKIILILGTLATILNSISYIKQYFNILVSEREYLNNIEYLYKFSLLKPGYEGYAGSVDLDNDQKIKEYMTNNVGFFEMSEMKDMYINYQNVNVYSVSKKYVNEYVLQDIYYNFDDDKSYVLIPKSLKDQEEEILAILNNNGWFVNFKTLIYEDIKISTILDYDFIRFGKILPKSIFIIDQSAGSLGGNSYFIYEGDQEEAQAYYNQVSQDFGQLPIHRIKSVRARYMEHKIYFIQQLTALMPIFIMILIAIIMNTYQLASLNYEIKDKKFALLKTEGKTIFELIIDEIGIGLLLLTLTELIVFVYMDVSFKDIAFITIAYFVVDYIVLWIVTKIKTKHFVERLR